MPWKSSRAPRLVWLWRVAVGMYVTAMFVGTHLPVVVVQGVTPSNDKALHFGAYGALGLLVGLQLSRPVRTAVVTLFAMAVWAAVDELTQPLVGRSAEVLDWLCDVLGAAAGIGMASTMIQRRRSP